ncbi:unnamed protein product [Camellia sinensis]
MKKKGLFVVSNSLLFLLLLPFLPNPNPNPVLSQPGGPLTTNKAAALPELVELAVKNAKDTVNASGASHLGRIVQRVDSFGDFEILWKMEVKKLSQRNTRRRRRRRRRKRRIRKKTKNKRFSSKDTADAVVKRPKKKLKIMIQIKFDSNYLSEDILKGLQTRFIRASAFDTTNKEKEKKIEKEKENNSMAFKAFISRVTSSFNSPENPIQLSPNPLFIDCQLATPLPFKPHCSTFKHHISSIFGCGFRTHEDDLPESPPCKWDETPRRDYNSSISNDSNDELFPPLPPHPPTRHPITTSMSGNSDNELFPPHSPPPTLTRHPITTSSADSGLCGYERDDEEEEIVTLSLNRKKRMKKLLPSFPTEGKVKDSFAMVMESMDPYEDFKASMMEMILAKQLFEAKDFEQLLECFFSLNLRHHHGVIVEAFSDIWKTIFLR